MEEKTSKEIKEESKDKKHVKSSSTSSSESEYELVCCQEQDDKIEHQNNNPVLLCANNSISEELINDAIGTGGGGVGSNNMNVVGKSIFYDCHDGGGNSDSDDEGLFIYSLCYQNHSIFYSFTDAATYEIEGGCKNEGNFTIFSNVIYLGTTNLNVPKSEAEILR